MDTPLFTPCLIALLALAFVSIATRDRPRGSKKRSRAIPKGTEGARRGRKPKADSVHEKKPIPAPGPALPME
jgi:hypothetical protein